MNRKSMTILEASEFSGLSKWTTLSHISKMGNSYVEIWLERFRCKLNIGGGQNG
jgi:hypothetical protein